MPAPTSRRVLVVEDNRDLRESLCLLLEWSGHQVEAAGDGAAGVQKALAWRPEVAVVDVGLPLLDGFGVARQVRAALGGQVRLIALTAYCGDSWRAAAAAAGFDFHLVKPTDPEVILRLVRGAPAAAGATE
jgi:CheY-like chemotaxis protein